ncbi:Protein of unknown function [Austwickia chelonae]|uniref:DUF3054 domain-containing protein n=1 Tax=Austwickia chelonae NBRC 105200 TaxID=1184607 RepID=K6VKA0_9MICO|nr:DUF3054 domain-containing protein [Austwickia chelonae]GAB77149.1 hypothetical protein AUCHE_05_00540 [Austwickia chelonae NBRC 105200]SEW03888.1 Protein of unknown function [Austwickia chelonae]
MKYTMEDYAVYEAPSAEATHAPRVPWAGFGVDIVLVLLFAVIGRISHAETMNLPGFLITASPFLAGTVAAWAVLVGRGHPRPGSLLGGTIIWVSTVAVGMALRALTGLSVQGSFVVVSLLFTGSFLLGWRALGDILVRRYSR